MTFILVILTVAIVISFELLRKAHQKKAHHAPELVKEHPSSFEVSDRYFHPAHTWVMVTNAETKVTVGTDDFSERIVGTLSGLELPGVGQMLQQGEPFAKLRHGIRVLAQVAPISGMVVEVNEELERNPTALNASPLDRGWIAKIIPSSLRTDLRNLLSGATADAWREAVHTQLIQMFAPNIGTMLQDGGEFVKNFGDRISDDDWKRLIHEFFPGVAENQSQNKPKN